MGFLGNLFGGSKSSSGPAFGSTFLPAIQRNIPELERRMREGFQGIPEPSPYLPQVRGGLSQAILEGLQHPVGTYNPLEQQIIGQVTDRALGQVSGLLGARGLTQGPIQASQIATGISNQLAPTIMGFRQQNIGNAMQFAGLEAQIENYQRRFGLDRATAEMAAYQDFFRALISGLSPTTSTSRTYPQVFQPLNLENIGAAAGGAFL